jgi:hypothetical protein
MEREQPRLMCSKLLEYIVSFDVRCAFPTCPDGQGAGRTRINCGSRQRVPLILTSVGKKPIIEGAGQLRISAEALAEWLRTVNRTSCETAHNQVKCLEKSGSYLGCFCGREVEV